MPTVNPIRSEADYQAALARVQSISQTQPGELEFDELEVLTILLAAYEARQLTDAALDSVTFLSRKYGYFTGSGAGLPAAYLLRRRKPRNLFFAID